MREFFQFFVHLLLALAAEASTVACSAFDLSSSEGSAEFPDAEPP